MKKPTRKMQDKAHIAAMKDKPRFTLGNGSPHGFLRLHVSNRDFRGDRSYTIYYGKKSELFYCENEQEALDMWRRLCKLELLIVKTIGGEILNQW